MCKVSVQLRELVKQRLAAAAEEIFELLERTMREYEEETERQRRLMETLLQPRVLLSAAESGPSSLQPSEWTPSLPQDPPPPYIQEDQNPKSHHIKEEQEEESSSQESSHRDFITSQLWKGENTAPPSEFEEVLTTTQVSMKTEEEEAPETWTQPVQHNHTVDRPEPPAPVAPSGDALLHLNNTEADRMRANPRKRFPCSLCHKTYASNFHLQSHMRVHTGEKPFSCLVCEKSFTVKGNLDQHMMIHYGLKPYTCSFCGKAFSQKSNLNNHYWVHTGVKPFSCSVCGKQYRQKSSLSLHMSTH